MNEVGHGQRTRGRLDLPSAGWTALLLLVLLAAWWFGARAYETDRIDILRTEARRQAGEYAAGLRLAIAPRAASVEGLARFVADSVSTGSLTSDEFTTFAAGQYSFGAGIRTVQVAPDGVIRWTFPLAGNEKAVGLDILNHPDAQVRADVRRTWDGDALTVSAPFELAQGGLGLALRKTVRVDGRPWGIAAIIMDVPPLMAEAGLDGQLGAYGYAVRDSSGRVFRGDARIAQADPVSATVALPEGAWTVLLAPRGGWASVAGPDVTLFRAATLAIVALVTLSSYLLISRQRRLAQLVSERTRDLAESERRARALFERSPISLWQEDFSGVKRSVDELKAAGVTDLRAYLRDHPDELQDIVSRIGITDVNGATLALYDAADKADLLAGISEYATDESWEIFAAEIVAVAQGRTSFWGDSAMRTPSGATKHLAVRWTVMPGHEEDYGSVVVSVVDLTDRVRAQRELDAIRQNLEALVERRTAELVRVNEELLDAQKAKDAFLANMSHELRTPLNSVLGFTGIMLQEIPGPLNEEQHRQLEMVRRSGRQLLALVNDVLDLAKIETGHSGIEFADVSVADLVASVAEVARPVVEGRGLAFHVSSENGDVVLRTDRDRVEQVLMNLLTNAAKFTPSGSVSLRSRMIGSDIAFDVSDTGPGIPADQRESIFQPFYQLPSITTAKSAGTGLGLAIARDLAGLLGGSLGVCEQQSAGACFRLLLPVRLPEDRGADA